MKRLSIIRGGVAMALMLGVLVAVASGADASPSGQLRVYMREGLSLERAQVALATQTQVEAAKLPTKIEEALGASFAGMWFEPRKGKFCIGVISSASRRAAEQVVAQAGLAGVVSYVSVRSTWTQLISAQGEWGLKLARLRGQQFSTGLTASNNAVSVTLSSSVPEHERALLEREAARSDVNVSITIVPPEALAARPSNSKCEFIKSGEAYCSKPIAAGVLITTQKVANPTSWCTAGPLAILSNPATLAAELETLIITAGHCTEGTKEWFTSTHPLLNRVTQEIGSTVFALFDLGGDYGDIEVGANWLEAGVTPALGQITNYQDNGLREARNVIGEEASMEGASFCSQGATSAEQCGTIAGTNRLVNFLIKEPDVLLHIDGLVETKSCVNEGDSGGPVATLPLSGNAVHILGTLVGGIVRTCSGLICTTCTTYYEPIKTSLTGLGLTLLTISNQTRHTGGHPSFLTASKQTLLFVGEGSNPVLRALQAGIPATIECQKVLMHGFILHQSTLAHLLGLLFENKCVRKINGGAAEECNPLHITTKPILAELGLLKSGSKTVVILMAAGDGTTEFAKFICGGSTTTVGGVVVGEIPENNALGEKQYNVERAELEVIFASNPSGSDQQKITTIFLLGKEMTGQELKVEGFLGGKAAEEAVSTFKADGKVKIDV